MNAPQKTSSRLEALRKNIQAPPKTIAVYIALYIPIGFVMNGIGQAAEIAEFANWWQVLTCYGLYLIPCSLVIRHRTYWDQYLFGVFMLGLLETLGYAFGTSIAHEGNILDQILGPRNFALAMSLWFGVYLPAGNFAVSTILKKLG
ncbi:MAG: hypothetical protein P8R54_28830 [Myxococcota bacterium]|nr:hypothetical protein [Myxococcota bacterium]